MSKNDIKKTLNSLEFTIEESDEVFLVTPPSYRFDINIEEDLIEEVIRIYGFDKIKATPPTTNIEDAWVGL